MVSAARRVDLLDTLRRAIKTPRSLTREQQLQIADDLAHPRVTQPDLFGKASLPTTPHQGVHHHCHWPGCTTHVKPALWGCKYHWFLLPEQLRNEIWRTYRPGQEITKRPSAEYIAVARRVQDWIAKQGR